MTLKQAAKKLGHKDSSSLHHAVRRGILRTSRVGDVHVTTQEWLDAYVAHVQAVRGGKGKKRGPRSTPPTPPETEAASD